MSRRAGIHERGTPPSERGALAVRITDAGTIVGRLLVALGAPQGQKAKREQRFGLPDVRQYVLFWSPQVADMDDSAREVDSAREENYPSYRDGD